MNDGYFCYVSRSKVDQILSTHSPGELEDYREIQTSEKSLGTKASGGLSLGGILKLFSGDVSYGRKGIVQRERHVKAHYLEKLRLAMISIASKNSIPSIVQETHAGVPSNGLFHHFRGLFRIVDPIPFGCVPAENVISIRSELAHSTLMLDCSLRFFSEGQEPDDRFAVNSSNSRFFAGDIDLCLETVFLLLGCQGSTMHGTPLYLMIPEPTDGQLGFYL